MKLKQLFIIASVVTMPAYAQQKWDLKQCIDHAIANNLTIKLQEAQREQSKVELSTAKNSFLPDLNGSASHSFNFGRSLQADNTYQSLNTQNTGLNLSTSIPLFSGLQKINNVALSKLNLQAAMEDLNKAKEDISIQVASAYLQVLFNEELVKVANEQLALSKEMLEQKTAFYKNGKASQAEWYEAKARVAQDELSAVQAENNRCLSLLAADAAARASARIYVPLLHTTRILISGRLHSSNSISSITSVFGFSSTSSPLRARSYARLPSTLQAEKAGGICSIVPTKFFSVSSTSWRVICSVGYVASISFSRSYEGVVAPSCSVAIYSLV